MCGIRYRETRFPLPEHGRQTPPSAPPGRSASLDRARARERRPVRRSGARAGDPARLRARLARVRRLVRRARAGADARRAGDGRRVPGRRGRPRVPPGHDRQARRRDRRRAPRAGQPNPCDSAAVAAVLAGIRRSAASGRCAKPSRSSSSRSRACSSRSTPPRSPALRDRALLLLGFAAALRRSELVALDVEDLHFDAARGLLVTIRRSKADQEQEGARVAVPYAQRDPTVAQSGRYAATSTPPASIAARCSGSCAAATTSPTAALRPVRRADRQAPRAQAPASPPALLSGHSLRAGYATAAAAAGVEERKIANVTRHRNLPVLRGYIRAATAFDDVGAVL